MTIMNDGGPAFPFGQISETTGQPVNGFYDPGISTRDYFAAKVCAALLTSTSADADYPNLDYQKTPGGQTIAERIAGISYRMADAMLKARENKE